MGNSANALQSKYSEEEIQACVALLNDLVKNTEQLALISQEVRVALLAAAGQLSRPDRDEIRKRRRDSRRVKRHPIHNY